MSLPTPTSTGFVTQLNSFDPQALVLALQEGFLEHVQLQPGRFGGQIVHSISTQCRTDWGQYNLALLARGDLLEYFSALLAELNPPLQTRPWMKPLRAGLEEIRALLDMPEGKPFTASQVQSIYDKSSALVLLLTKSS